MGGHIAGRADGPRASVARVGAAPDREWGQAAGRRQPSLAHLIDARRGRAVTNGREQPEEIWFRAFGHDSHGRAGLVGHPASEPQRPGSIEREHPEANALDATDDREFEASSRQRLAHEGTTRAPLTTRDARQGRRGRARG
jgi:hypothetical protein